MTGSTALAPAPAAPDPAERGELTIAPQVVEKIAVAVAAEVAHVGGSARRVLNLALGSDEGAEHPQVDARVDGTVVTVQVRCSVAYPAPVTTVTEKLRAHLVDRIEALTGLRTRQVDITVSALTTARRSARRELE